MDRLPGDGDRIAILAHGAFPHDAKTAVGLLRYGDAEVAAILDETLAEDRVRNHAPDLPDAPIHADFEAIRSDVDALVIGIAPIGGGFLEAWRPDVEAALRTGGDVVAGLHDVLGDDPALARLATEHGGTIHDVREPPRDLDVGRGVVADLDTDVVLTVGTDCSVGKMTTTFEVVAAARERGIDAAAIPTGQTGIMVAGHGIAIDRVPADFVSGAVERMIHELADHDLLVVEGQGCIAHPAYSADTIGILHGAMADALVLVHDPTRDHLAEYDGFELPAPERFVHLYEDVAEPVHPSTVVAGAVDTSAYDDARARSAIDAYEAAIDAPATDVVRNGADRILDAVRP